MLFDDFEQNLTPDTRAFTDPGFAEIFHTICSATRAGRVLVTCRYPIPDTDAALLRFDAARPVPGRAAAAVPAAARPAGPVGRGSAAGGPHHRRPPPPDRVRRRAAPRRRHRARFRTSPTNSATSPSQRGVDLTTPHALSDSVGRRGAAGQPRHPPRHPARRPHRPTSGTCFCRPRCSPPPSPSTTSLTPATARPDHGRAGAVRGTRTAAASSPCSPPPERRTGRAPLDRPRPPAPSTDDATARRHRRGRGHAPAPDQHRPRPVRRPRRTHPPPRRLRSYDDAVAVAFQACDLVGWGSGGLRAARRDRPPHPHRPPQLPARSPTENVRRSRDRPGQRHPRPLQRHAGHRRRTGPPPTPATPTTSATSRQPQQARGPGGRARGHRHRRPALPRRPDHRRAAGRRRPRQRRIPARPVGQPRPARGPGASRPATPPPPTSTTAPPWPSPSGCAAADPGNAEYQRDLSVSHDRLGDLAVAAGDTTTADQHYRADPGHPRAAGRRRPRQRRIPTRPVGQPQQARGPRASRPGTPAPPSSTTAPPWPSPSGRRRRPRQRRLPARPVGQPQQARGPGVAAGDTTTADQHYRAALAIAERLAAADPGNAEYQRDLGQP